MTKEKRIIKSPINGSPIEICERALELAKQFNIEDEAFIFAYTRATLSVASCFKNWYSSH